MPRKDSHKRTWKIVFTLLLVSILVLLYYTGYDWWLERRAEFVHYPEFGVDIPKNYAIHGIDVSKYQSIIDWNSVKEMRVGDVQVEFVFIKATEGLDDEDAYLQGIGEGLNRQDLPGALIIIFSQPRAAGSRLRISSIQ